MKVFPFTKITVEHPLDNLDSLDPAGSSSRWWLEEPRKQTIISYRTYE
jgi:hypothetical protein